MVVYYITSGKGRSILKSDGTANVMKDNGTTEVSNPFSMLYYKYNGEYIPMHKALFEHINVTDAVELLHKGDIMSKVLYYSIDQYPNQVRAILYGYFKKYGRYEYKTLVKYAGLFESQIQYLFGHVIQHSGDTESLRKQLNDVEIENKGKELELHELRAARDELQTRIEEKINELDDAKAVTLELQKVREERDALVKDLENMRSMVEGGGKRAEAMEADIKGLNDKLAALDQTRVDAESELKKVRDQRDTLQNDLNITEGELKKVIVHRETLQTNLKQSRNRIETLEAEINNLNTRIKGLETDIINANRIQTQLNTTIKNTKYQLRLVSDERDNLVNEHKRLSQVNETRVKTLEAEIDKLNARIKELIENHDEYRTNATKIINNMGTGIKGLIAERDEYKMNIAKIMNNTNAQITRLKQTINDTESAMKKVTAQRDELLNKTEEFIEPLQVEIQRLNDVIHKLQITVTEAREELLKVRNEYDLLLKQMAARDTELAKLVADRLQLDERITTLEKEIQSNEALIDQLKKELAECYEANSVMKKRDTELQQTIENLKNEKQEMATTIAEHKRRIGDLETTASERNKLISELNDCRTKYSELIGRMQDLEKRYRDISAENKRLNDPILRTTTTEACNTLLENVACLISIGKKYNVIADDILRSYTDSYGMLSSVCAGGVIDQYTNWTNQHFKAYTDLYKLIIDSFKDEINDILTFIANNSNSGVYSKDLVANIDKFKKLDIKPAELRTCILISKHIDNLYKLYTTYREMVRNKSIEYVKQVSVQMVSTYIPMANRILERIKNKKLSKLPVYTEMADRNRMISTEMNSFIERFSNTNNEFNYNDVDERYKFISSRYSMIINDNEDLGAVRVYVKLNISDSEYKQYNGKISRIATAVVDKKDDSHRVQFTDVCENLNNSMPFIWKSQCVNRLCGPFYDVFSDTKFDDSKNEVVSSTADMYSKMSSTFNQLIAGYNIVIFGTGYSGSGKTYTLYGSRTALGLTQLVLTDVIDRLNKTRPGRVHNITIHSIDDIYGDRNSREGGAPSYAKDYIGNIININSIVPILTAITKKRIADGRVKPTPNNIESSRAHLVIRFAFGYRDANTPFQVDETIGHFTVIDMGGMENDEDILTVYRESNAVEHFHFDLIPYTDAYFKSIEDVSKRNIVKKRMVETIHVLLANVKKQDDLKLINASLITTSLPDGVNPLDFRKITMRYTKEHISRIINEGVFINKSIQNMNNYFRLKLTGNPASMKKLNKLIRRDEVGMYKLLDSLEGKAVTKPTKFINLVLIWNNATSLKHCIGGNNSMIFTLNVASTIK